RILKQSIREPMWSPVKLNSGASHPYGFGWELGARAGRKFVRHGGALPGFRAAFTRFVDDKITIVVLANSDNADPGSIAFDIAALYLPDGGSTTKSTNDE